MASMLGSTYTCEQIFSSMKFTKSKLRSRSANTPRGEAFVIEEDDENEFYMFASQKNLDILKNCANWFCDGTFDVAPLGYQLYTIHALVDENRTVPLLPSGRNSRLPFPFWPMANSASFQERIIALKDGTMRSASVSHYPIRRFEDSSKKLSGKKVPTKC
ncbi:unnamed protein product [Clavelina lepadiformis]|uniref:HAT C-terminal dimerisation domain-containing protein n=1 Tax=Clavelina lepadiformis TaxID=159417 RepID=A0ABP0G8I8_CLALP